MDSWVPSSEEIEIQKRIDAVVKKEGMCGVGIYGESFMGEIRLDDFFCAEWLVQLALAIDPAIVRNMLLEHDNE